MPLLSAQARPGLLEYSLHASLARRYIGKTGSEKIQIALELSNDHAPTHPAHPAAVRDRWQVCDRERYIWSILI
jgi:hypothetical protein